MADASRPTPREIIRHGILFKEGRFNLTDLFCMFGEEHGLTGSYNRTLIIKILEELCESGVVKYSEVEDNVWAYSVVRPWQERV